MNAAAPLICPLCDGDVGVIDDLGINALCVGCGTLLVFDRSSCSLREATADEVDEIRRRIDLLETIQSLICLRRELLTGGRLP